MFQHSIQPAWARYMNVTATGDLRYVHYVNTYETYPRYCDKAPPSGFPSQLECDGAGATEFYSG